jgi:hypothetical protein
VAVGGDKVVHTVAGSVAVVPGVCTRALKEKGWWAGPIWWVAGTVAIGRAQQQAFPICQIIFKPSNFENSKPNLPYHENFRNCTWWYINPKGTIFLLGRSSNSKWILNYKF